MASILTLFLQAWLLAVLATYLLRYYEWRNLTPEQRGETDERLAPWFTATVAVLWEYLTSLAVLVLVPFGWLDNDPERRFQDETERPILFVPGLIETRTAFLVLRRFFRRRGHAALFTLNLGPVNGSLETLSELIAERVDEIRAQTGKSQVDLICHGVGGVAARLFVRNGGADKVGVLLTIGSPHRGSRLAVLFSGRLARELGPGSRVLPELNESLPEGPRYVNVFSSFDSLILPATNGELSGAENHRLEYLGHTALLFSSEVQTVCGRVIDGPPTATQPREFHAEYPNE